MTTDLSLMRLFLDASLLVQLVMLLLLMMSLASWTLIFQRNKSLKRAQKLFDKFANNFNDNKDLNSLYEKLAVQTKLQNGCEKIILDGFSEFAKMYKQKAEPFAIMEASERAMRVALAKENLKLEKHLPFLATVGSISVYIGLFGTVWGIMSAFRALGNVQQATLAMVAPGISEALVATALGLFTAIPAVYAYNRFSNKVNYLAANYDTVADEFSNLLYRKLYSQDQTFGNK